MRKCRNVKIERVTMEWPFILSLILEGDAGSCKVHSLQNLILSPRNWVYCATSLLLTVLNTLINLW